jgi:OPT family small oligopeptide transporter
MFCPKLTCQSEFITGYIQPGRPLAMMLFKTYGYITMAQGLYFAQDLKLGQYMKIPPRSMFMAQTIATLWACIVQVAVLEWALGGAIADICTQHQANKFNCPNGRVFFNASVIWGVIGPQRIFSAGSLYANLQWFWLAGILAPILFYLLARAFPRIPFRYLSAPLIFGGSGQIPPATPLNYLAWGIVGFVFNKHIRNKYRGWWMRFNYITSAGLDVGLAICTIVIILSLNLTNTSMPSWWGVSAANNNADNLDTAVKIVNPNPSATGRFFGPTAW